jgi:mannose-1-phosphate guanylyltransferase
LVYNENKLFATKKRSSMKAMILAAGFGTRLRPLTEHCPKALMPVGNRPLLDRNIDYLKSYGVTEIIVNAHHLPGQLLDHVRQGERFQTGGGIRNVSDFWDEDPFIVMNGDILTDVDLGAAYAAHLTSGALATLILHSQEPFNQILLDSRQNVYDIGEQNVPGRLAFTGIHIISPEALAGIPPDRFSSVIDHYRKLIISGKQIHGFLSEGHLWHDIGTLSSYLDVNRVFTGTKRFLLGDGCHVHSEAVLTDWAVLGESCVVEQRSRIARSVIWDHVTVREGVNVVESVVTSYTHVTQDVIGAIF